jgi:predicted DNA-binding protein with PD1-like motif
MQSKLVSKPNETRVWIAVLEKGEEAREALLSLARQEAIENASFVALGALKRR